MNGGFGTGAAGLMGVLSACACASLAGALGWIALGWGPSRDWRRAARPWLPVPPDACTLDRLVFYYDDDDELQCECLDDVDDDEWSPQ